MESELLSKADRIVLIQSHIEAFLMHIMWCLELPKHKSKYSDKCNEEFLGGSLTPKKTFHL